MNEMNSAESEMMSGEKYIADRHITQLFEALTVGLVHHRPPDILPYLISSLNKLRDLTISPIPWDALITTNFAKLKEQKSTDTIIHRPKPPACRKPLLQRSRPLHSSETQESTSGDLGRKEGDVEGDVILCQLESTLPETEMIFSDPEVMEVMKGRMHDLPVIPSNAVRIFLSSTFSDFKAERNILPKKVYPQLQKFCNDRGLDFQVVDMRWGVTDDVMNDHLVSELCIREIKMCKKVSCGPNFVVMLGNRYGYRPFPSVIEGGEFETCLKIAREHKLEDVELVLEWYTKDDNAVPPNYLLQSIGSKLLFYKDMTEENAGKRSEDQERWNDISQRIQHLLRQSVKLAMDEGSVTPNEGEKYFISVTEEEIQAGVLKATDSNIKSLCFRRKLNNLDADSEKSKLKVGRFLDLKSDKSIDDIAQDLLSELTENKVLKTVPEENVAHYEVPWTGEALEASTDEQHLQYLRAFSEDFVDKMKKSIDTSLILDKGVDKETTYGRLYLEVLHHANFAVMKSQMFCGRSEIIKTVKEYMLLRDKMHCPLVIHGQSGYGKTALLSHIARCTRDWGIADCRLVLRLLGTSPLSSNIFDVLQSTITQVHLSLEEIPPVMADFQMGDLRRLFWKMLTNFAKNHAASNLVIIFDSVDQLSETYRSHQLHWLPRQLPSNVFIIVSMLSDKYNCLENARARIDDAQCIVELGPLSNSIGEAIMSEFMSHAKRRLQEEQRKLVISAFEECRQPLFLKLVMDNALQWTSFTPLSSLRVARNVHEAISHLFEGLEGKYGGVFVPRALGYLTSSHGGLTGLEMEDLLSCDNQVLIEVYKYHDPPLQDTIRIPSLMWARVQDELQQYLIERLVDGKTVMAWYHRQFWEAATERFIASSEVRKDFHQSMAEMYVQTDGVRKTITLIQRSGMVMENADRGIVPQILSCKNLRKLSCLPFHLFHGEQLGMLRKTCIVNFAWLRVKLEAVGIGEVFRELTSYVDCDGFSGDASVDLMLDFLERSYSALHHDPNLLAFHALEMLEKFSHSDILLKDFIHDAQEWMENTKEALLLPTHPIKLLGLDAPLKFSKIVGHDGVISSDESRIVCNWSESNTNMYKIQTFDLKTKDILASVNVEKNSPLVITQDNKSFAYIEGMKLMLREIETGDLQKEFAYCADEYEAVTPRAIALSSSGRFVALGSRFARPKGVKATETWKTSSHISIVDLQGEMDVASAEVQSKKTVDGLIFVFNDQKLIATTKDRIIIYSAPDLNPEHHIKNLPPLFAGVALRHVAQTNTLAIGAAKGTSARIVLFNYETCSHKESNSLVLTEDEDRLPLAPFAIHASEDASRVLMGTATIGNSNRRSSLWMWNVGDEEAEEIPIGGKQWKIASQFTVSADWKFAIVGWMNGDLSVVDLDAKTEGLVFPFAHGHCVNSINFTQNEKKIVSLALDHSLKCWSTDVMLKPTEHHPSDEETDEPDLTSEAVLEPTEQCLDVTVHEDLLLTVSHANDQGPKAWLLKNGHSDQPLSEKFDDIFKKSLEEKDIGELNGGHAHFYNAEGVLIFSRRRRDALTVCVIENLRDPVIRAHKHFQETYLSLSTSLKKEDGGTEVLVFALTDGNLEKYDLDLNLLRSYKVPPITDDIINISSGAGRKKLLLMKMGITPDGKYLTIVNPSASKSGKIIDFLDLQEGSHQRVITKFLSWRILEDSFCFLHVVDQRCQLHTVVSAKGQSEDLNPSYKSLVTGETNCLSRDHSMGFEITKSNSVRLWTTNPLCKLHSLRGHIREVSCATFSDNNKFVVTGSLDNTVRLWSVETGSQLSMFHMYGAVTSILFDRSMQFMAVHFSAGPQRRRAAILKIVNL